MAVVDRLKDGTTYLKATYYDTEALPILQGKWEVSLKIDGIRVIRNANGVPCSRAGNPMLPHVVVNMPANMTDAELFFNNWNATMSVKAGTLPIHPSMFYSLDPLDKRLLLHPARAWSPEEIMKWLAWSQENKQEGIMLRQDDTWVKVVPLRHADIRIVGWYEGEGRLAGTFGGFVTHSARVGGGFSDKLRAEIWQVVKNNPQAIIGKIIQVKFREFTVAGKLRMPVFERFRFDKDTESGHRRFEDGYETGYHELEE